ncbi:uncharacterized protein F5891DRAFT_1073005, partial [Suillus fuscotomentosus]
MRFFFLTFIVGLIAPILSVTARQPRCSPPGNICVKDSDYCESTDTSECSRIHVGTVVDRAICRTLLIEKGI